MDNHIEVTEKQDKGFTLVELLIVIVILGILATVTVFAVRGITDQGQTSACQATQKTYQVAIEAWYAQNGSTAHPTGADLETDGFIREYNNADVEVIQGVGAGISTVGASAGGDCVGEIVAG